MSTSEITAYLFGAACKRDGLSLSRMFLSAAHKHLWQSDPELTAANQRLGSDRFAYWARRGYDEAGLCRG